MLNYHQPDARGHFGPYGGTFVAETLIHALDELRAAYDTALADSAMKAMKKSYQQEIYPGAGHGFLRNQAAPGGANLEATKKGWPRTIAFLRQQLGS